MSERTMNDQNSTGAGAAAGRGRSLDRQIPAMLHLLDAEGTLLDVSDHWLEVLGYAREEVVGRTISRFLTEQSRQYATSVADPLIIRDGSVQNLEYQVVKKNGEVIHALISSRAEFDDDGDFAGCLSVLTNVTDHVRSAADLRLNLTMLSTQREVSADGMLVVDGDRNWVDFNRRFIDMWGFSPAVEEARDGFLAFETIRDQLVDPDALRTGLDYLYDNPLEKSADEIEFVDGRVFERYSAPMIGDDGTYYGRMWSFRDITQRRNMESQLRQSQKMEAVGQLTAGVAHNFNNMLQGIMSNIEMVDETDSSRPFLVEATTASERAADMVRQLMLFARQGVQFEPRACDVGDLIERVVEICRSTFDRGFRISVDLQEDLRQTWGDPAQLEQVLLNLLLNARDAIAEVPASRMEKRIDIRAYSLHTEQPTADTRAGAYIRVEVADSGVGMDPETRRRIFNPFFTTKEIGDGSGLGLATAFGIVRHHGGWIDCDSALGVGSTFTIHLPVVSGDQQQEPTESSESDPPFPAGTETILIADDEYAVRNPVAMILRASGYSVLEARDGRETLFLLKSESHKIDLVLLDLSMPEISGHEVLKRLRTQHPGVKTVIFTGEPSESDVPDDETVLRKPIRLNELAQALRDVLDR